MNALAVSALLAALLSLAIGASVLLRDRTRRTYTSFAAFTFTLSAWHLCTFVAKATDSPLASWLALWPAATIPPTALAFFREFLAQPSIGGYRRPPRVTLAWTIAAYLALIYAALSGHAVHQSLWFQVPFGAYVFGGLYRCVYDLFGQYRRTVKRAERIRIRYVMVGGFVATTLALTDVLPRFGIAWPTIGNVLTILYLYFLSQSLFRYRLIDLNELVGKMAVLGSLVVLLWAVYGLLLTWIGAGQEGLFLLNALVASFVILILFEPVRSRLENGINRWLSRQRRELRGRLQELRRDLANVVDVPEMVQLIVAALQESRRVTDASIYLLDSAGAGYDLIGRYGAQPVDRVDAAAHTALFERMHGDGYVDLAELRRELEGIKASGRDEARKESLESMIQLLRELHTALVFAMFGSEETERGPWLLGLIAIRDQRVESDAFAPDDISLFKQLAKQAARTVEASQRYEHLKERDRMAAIGEMSAGLAHEIRNPLGAIKSAAQLLIGPDGEPIDPGPDAAEFIGIIIEEVNRLDKVVTQFLAYARTQRTEASQLGELSLGDVVSKTIKVLEKSEYAEGVHIELRLDDLLPLVAGDAEALHQVFLNLGLNALQAMEDKGGKLEIITTRRRRSRLGYGSFAEVRFRDTGVGIPRDKIRELFVPFFTTRERGTGLGLPICQRIVDHHGGTIEVRSQPGVGSTFSVFLPALGPSLPERPELTSDAPDGDGDGDERSPGVDASAGPRPDRAASRDPAPAPVVPESSQPSSSPGV